MTKLERAVKEAAQLPDDLSDHLGEQLLHYIHKHLTFRDDVDAGLLELDAGLGLDGYSRR